LFHFFSSQHKNITNVLNTTLDKLNQKDPETMQQLSDAAGTIDPAIIENYRKQLISQIEDSKDHIANDPKSGMEDYASRDPFVGLVQTNMGKTAHAIGVPAMANVASDWQKYGDADPRWALCPIVSFFTWKEPRHQFVGSSNIEAFTYAEHSPKFTIAIMADWGAANDAARQVAQQITARNPDYVIHLGDTYYAGTQPECHAVLDMWPLKDAQGNPVKDKSFALNGNHEMFCGARNYYGTILPAFNQPSSYFKIKTEYWQFMGLDTAYTGGCLSHPEVQVQWDWLVGNLKVELLLTTVFLTHHQPVSAHAQESSDARPLHDDVQALISQTQTNLIFGWFFGHEHRAVIYDDKVTGYQARLIGNGAIPHDVQSEAKPDEGCTPFTCVNTGTYGEGNAISSFVLLTVEGPRITVEYIDQNGKASSIPTETWMATCERQLFP
jgi:hypothetical protein